MIGYTTPDAGHIRIFGYKPGEAGSGVPGNGIGFMPQETALHDDLTIKETLAYFGLVNLIKRSNLRDRINFLVKLLELPSKHRLIRDLSGGQKRRVSFGCVLIHEPRLLILDEPTVGADPMLRETTWQILETLTKKARITVIITTHYIEETRRANRVGFMRKGTLLAEGRPQDFIDHFNVQTLEDVFYKLCYTEKKKKRESFREKPSKSGEHEMHTVNTKISNNYVPLEQKGKIVLWPLREKKKSKIERLESWIFILMAIVRTLILRMFRQPEAIFTCVLLPIFIGWLFAVCIGNPPSKVPVAIVNEDTNPVLSKLLLENINSEIISQIHTYKTMDEAIGAVKDGEIWGIVHFKPNFTESLAARTFFIGLPDNNTIEQSLVKVHGDFADQFMKIIIERTLEADFQNFLKDMMGKLEGNPLSGQLPLALGYPIYGKPEIQGARDFYVSGLVFAIVCAISLSFTILDLKEEKNHKMFERNYVSGVSCVQIILGNLITRFTLVFVECFVVLFICIYVLHIQCHGSFLLALSLLVLNGVAAMLNGMFLSSFIDDFPLIVLTGVGYFLYLLITSGILWPFEAMPYFMRWYNSLLPLTLPTRSMRNILLRGHSLFHPQVYPGFVITFLWIGFFYLATIILFKYKK